MAEWKPSKYVSAAIGWIDSGLRKKMETHYDLKKEYSPNQNYANQSGAPSREETENLIREIYSNIALFEKLVYKNRK